MRREVIPIDYTWKKWRNPVLLLGIVYLFLHFYPYFSSDIILTSDYLNIGATLRSLSQPELFQAGGVVDTFYGEAAIKAPLYYYPASLLVGTVHVMNIPRVIGGILGVLTFILAGRCWESWWDGIRALVITVVFVHLSGSVNPMIGLQRSVTLPALLFFLHPISRSNVALRLLGLAVVSGFYPPAGVLLLGFTGLEYLVAREGLYERRNPVQSLLLLGSHVLVFLFTVSPFLVNQFVLSGETAFDNVRTLYWNLNSWRGIFQTFVSSSNRALFKVDSTFEMFAVFLGLSLTFYLAARRSRRDFVIKFDTKLVLLNGVALWFLANFLHPLLYQPGRYTRVSLLLGILLVFTQNISSLGSFLRKKSNHSFTWRWGLVVLPVAGLINLMYQLWQEPVVLYRWYVLRELFWPAVMAGGSVLIAALGHRRFRKNGALFLLMAFSMTMVVFPHYFGNFHGKGFVSDIPKSQTELLKAVGELPRDAVLAGPPSIMNLVPAYAAHDVYFNQERDSIETICRRSKSFPKVYFAPDRRTIERYFRRTPVTHIIVDRSFFQGRRFYRCGGYIRVRGRGSYLNQIPAYATWTYGSRGYIVSKSAFLNNSP